MMKLLRVLVIVGLLSLSGAVFAKGGGKSPPSSPPPPPPPPTPAEQKSPVDETVSRRNKKSGMATASSTMLTGGDPNAAETGINLGGNSLLGS